MSDNEGSLLNFSQSCNRNKKESPHCIVILYLKMFWIESCLGSVLFDTILCVIMQGIIYLCLKDYSEVGQTRFFIAFVSSSPLNEYCDWVHENFN